MSVGSSMGGAEESQNVLAYRVKQVEEAILDIRSSIRGIDENLKALTSLEYRHAEMREALKRVYEKIESMEVRMVDIEHAMPLLKLTSAWVKAGVLAVVGLVLIAALKIALGI